MVLHICHTVFVQWDNSRENEVSIGNSPNCAHSSNNRIGERFSVNSATYQWFTFEIWSGPTIAEYTVQSIHQMLVNPPRYNLGDILYTIGKNRRQNNRLSWFLCLFVISKIALVFLHSWAKFKIVLVRKPGRKFYYFMEKFQGSGFSFQSLNQNIKVVVFPSNFWIQFFKVVVFPSNFWNATIIWQILRVILNFSQEY